MYGTLAICGSMSFLREMQDLADGLDRVGCSCLLPTREDGQGDMRPSPTVKRGYIGQHLQKITRSDAILVANFEKKGVSGYVGPNTLMEMAFAYALHKPIFVLNPLGEQPCKEEVLAMQALNLEGELANLEMMREGLSEVMSLRGCYGCETIIGLDIGGTKTAVVEGTREAAILQRVAFATHAERGVQNVLAELFATVEQVRATALANGHQVQALSVSIGGPLDIARGIIYSPPNLPDWEALPLKDLLAERFKLPVYVEHDGNAGALAEWRFGAGQGARSLIFLTMGTGLGGGMILDGRLYRGASDMAGEVGHMRIAPDGPVAYGKAGAWEAFCAGPAFAVLARRTHPQRFANATTPEIVRLALAGDAEAVAVVREAGDYLGQGLAILVDVLNPERIVIGSMAVRLGELVLGPARAAMQREALPRALAACQVVPAALGERIGDVASLCAAIEALAEGR